MRRSPFRCRSARNLFDQGGFVVKSSRRFSSTSLAGVLFASASLWWSGTVAPAALASSPPVRHQAHARKDAPAAFPLTLTDEAGHRVTVPKRPVHIASTTEGTDEILSALVPRSDVAMVTTYATNPQYSNIAGYAKGIPAINQVNAEQVLAVHPDLVLMASYNSPGVVKQIEQAGVPVFEFTDFNSIANIEQNIDLVGRLVGETARAERVVAAMNRQIRQIRADVAKVTPITVLDYGSYGYVAGRDTTVDSVIRDAGGINAAAGIDGWKTVTDEEIVKLDPQVIIDSSDDTGFLKKVAHDPGLASVAAVKDHRLYYIDSAHLTAVSQYVVRGVRDVAHALYPSVVLPADSRLQ